MKVMTILGTRPEIIRLSRVISCLDQHVEHVLTHTGQNYDYELSKIFFEELGVRKPDHYLEVAGATLGEQLGNILIRSERVLIKEQVDALLVLGDTNSALSAIIAKRLKIPIYHMEAGNRCFDLNVPEEINRKIVDHVADFNLIYSEHARRHLLAEGLPPRRIYLTGSPMKEVLEHHRPQIDRSTVLSELGLEPGRYLLASLHREENVDNLSALRGLIGTLQTLAERFQRLVIVSTHPRTRQRLSALGVADAEGPVRFLRPFGYFAYNKLQTQAFCVLSDSGTISEEAAILGFPAVTVRNAIERPEALDTGSIIVTGLHPQTIIDAVEVATKQHAAGQIPPIPDTYLVGNVSQRVVRLILGTARLSNLWYGIPTSP